MKGSKIYIEKLNLSTRTYNCLKKNNIDTVNNLLEVTDEELKRFRNLGVKSLEEIKNVILKLNSGEFDVQAYDFNKTITNTELTLLDIIANKDERILKILFYDGNEGYVNDISIERMNLSIRSINALRNNGYKYASQLIDLKIVSLNKINNLGEKCENEIIDNLKSLVYIIYEEANTTKIQLINELSNVLLEDYSKCTVEYNEKTLKSNIYMILKRSSILTSVTTCKVEELIVNKDFIYEIYNNNFLSELLKEHILKVIKKSANLIQLSEIRDDLPKHLKHSDILINILNELIADKKIERFDDSYRIWYPRLNEYINTLEDVREKKILYYRFQGKTLEDMGQQLGITRERIRQLEKKAVSKFPRLREDDYFETFKKYNLTQELFENIYGESDLVYGYLKYKYSKGNKSPEDILEDNDIPIQVRLRVEKIILKDFIIVGGNRIKKDRNEILDYILRTYCRDEVTCQDVMDLYSKTLEDYGLDEISELTYPKRYFETKLANSKKVLWKYGKKLRYYDMSELTPQKIIQSLNLNNFKDVEYSTLKFFNEYSEFMKEWDIRDEYELHNLMKKVFEEKNELNIKFTRMPNIEFGKPDRDMQVLEILLQTAPINNFDLANSYEQDYGIKAKTVLANYFKCIDEFCHNGIFSIDSEPLAGEEFDVMKEKLVNDIYFINDVKEMYINLFPKGNLKLINTYNLKRLGFKVNTQIIYSDKFTSSEEYFRRTILNDDIFDATLLDSRLTCCQTYYNALQILKEKSVIIEFMPNKFVNIRRLEQKGICRENLKKFTDDVYEFIGDEIFTIKSLNGRGFEHELYALGFDDWFYSSLLRCDNRFKFRRFEGNVLFRRGVEAISLNDLVQNIVSKYRSIDIYDLSEIINDIYGISVDKSRIPYIIKEKELYYNAIMEKVYIDYDEYFEEV